MSMTDMDEANEEYTWTPATEEEVEAAFGIVCKYLNEKDSDTSGLRHALGIVLTHYESIEVELDLHEHFSTEEPSGCRFCNLE